MTRDAPILSQVIELAPQDIEPPPAFGTQVKRLFLKGMAKADKKFVLILDLEELLSDQTLSEASAATTQSHESAAAGDAVPDLTTVSEPGVAVEDSDASPETHVP